MRRIALAAPLAAVALLAAGCGGIDKGKLESAIKRQTTEQLRIRGSDLTVARVECTKTRDDYHFSCLVTADNGSTTNVTASCDHDGRCSWRRA